MYESPNNQDTSLSLGQLRSQIIGRQTWLETPFGRRLMTYADFTASGRGVDLIEDYLRSLMNLYANTHTEDNATGRLTSHLMHQAERSIKRLVGAGEETCLVAVGSGSTAAICRFQEILGLRIPPVSWDRLAQAVLPLIDGESGKSEPATAVLAKKLADLSPVVFIGPYEHHSNDVTWQECFAEIVEIPLDSDGGLDLQYLEEKVSDPKYSDRLRLGSFSAASNVTGVLTPVYEVARILHRHGALACFDFAAAAPYIHIDMNRDSETYFDAVFMSPHKYLGGPGSPGLLLFRRSLYREDLAPTQGGGGTVDYVGPLGHDFSADIETRETSGTPPILQLMRGALALELKEQMGPETIEQIEQQHISLAMERLGANPDIDVLGPADPKRRLAILSFNLRHGRRVLHPRLVTRLLCDLFGIQSRAGCSCAGPYGHRLLGIGNELSQRYRTQIQRGLNGLKPGWVRVNFHYTMTRTEVELICRAIELLAKYGPRFLPFYRFDLEGGAWTAVKTGTEKMPDFGLNAALQQRQAVPEPVVACDELESYLRYTEELALSLPEPTELVTLDEEVEPLRFFEIVNLQGADARLTAEVVAND